MAVVWESNNDDKAMNWDAIGAVGEILGALVVVLTLLYLGRQIAQTNRISRSTVIRNLQQKYESFYTLLASDLPMAELAAKMARQSYEPESDIESERLDNLACMIASMWFSIQVAYDEGQLSEREYKIYCDDVSGRLALWPAIKPYLVKNIDTRWPTAHALPILKPIYTD